ncbi:MAG TPA: MMPL family transporter [Solirubrobacteraceae bacterium]|jgi:hydrophobe/amphiphile efflux-3 (HAE3) family protein|nr:MMPL family transporter [Solirubrobacteraceae bacterium]
MGRLFSGLALRAARRPLLTLGLFTAIGIACAIVALSLRPTAATDTLVGSSSSAYKNTQSFYKHFGEEPVEVLVKGDLRKLVLSSDIDRLVGLEGCMSPSLPVAALSQEGGVNGPCGQLMRSKAVKVVFGPGTFLNEAAVWVDEALVSRSAQAEAQAKQAQSAVYRKALASGLGVQEARTLGLEARKATMAGFAAEVSALSIRYGLSSAPTLDDHEFVSKVVFDPTKPSGTPNQRFAYLFPSREAALVSIRLKAGLSEAQRSHAIGLIRRAVAMSQWHLQNGETYLVTGEPVIVSDVTSSISHSIELLLIAVLLVMGLVLSLIFKGRPRLLPLAIALLATALTFGALALSGASLTMASVAVLPVLVGLSVDYAIQFQSRVEEARADGAGDTLEAIRRAALHGVPTIATAVLASIGGLLVLMLSPVPMVRGFGLLLVLGVAIAFFCALTAGSAALMLVGRRDQRVSGRGFADADEGMGESKSRLSARARARILVGMAPAWQGAREILTENAASRFISNLALDRAVRHPGRVLGIGLALAALGWGLDTQTQVQTDISKLAPQNLSSLHNLNELERVTGVGGEIDLMVSSSSLTKVATIEWMSAYEGTILERFGYSSAKGCGHAQLCPAFSLPDLFHEGEGSTAKLTQKRVNALLAALPPYFSEDVITPDRHVATLAFGIRLMSLQQQQHVIEQMQSSLRPPAGVSARLVGLSVLAAQAGAQIASPWRRVVTLLVALAAVALILLVAFRGDRRRALVPLVPIVLATGWSALVVFALRIPLNPMSVTLGALVIAISTEFSVLLSERHRQERLAGHSTVQALRRAYRYTGAAVAASGVTAIAGFGVLVCSDIAMLRDFGLVTLVDLSVSLLGVLIALPAAVVLAESGQPLSERIRDGLGTLRGVAPRRRARRRGLTAP